MKLSDTLSKAKDQLETLDDRKFDHLEFDWEGIRFHAAADAHKLGGGQIHLKADLGRLYFTVEDSVQRSMAIERLYSTNRQIDGKYAIGKKGDVSFRSVTKTAEHLKGTHLMSAITLILLEAENHLRALRAHLKPL